MLFRFVFYVVKNHCSLIFMPRKLCKLLRLHRWIFSVCVCWIKVRLLSLVSVICHTSIFSIFLPFSRFFNPETLSIKMPMCVSKFPMLCRNDMWHVWIMKCHHYLYINIYFDNKTLFVIHCAEQKWEITFVKRGKRLLLFSFAEIHSGFMSRPKTQIQILMVFQQWADYIVLYKVK